jgi:hypothetical protein
MKKYEYSVVVGKWLSWNQFNGNGVKAGRQEGKEVAKKKGRKEVLIEGRKGGRKEGSGGL